MNPGRGCFILGYRAGWFSISSCFQRSANSHLPRLQPRHRKCACVPWRPEQQASSESFPRSADVCTEATLCCHPAPPPPTSPLCSRETPCLASGSVLQDKREAKSPIVRRGKGRWEAWMSDFHHFEYHYWDWLVPEASFLTSSSLS